MVGAVRSAFKYAIITSASLVATGIAAMAPAASTADLDSGSPAFRTDSWIGKAYVDDSGKPRYCRMIWRKGKPKLFVTIHGNGEWTVGVVEAPGIGEDDIYMEVAIYVDGAPFGGIPVNAVTKSSVSFDFPTRNRLFEALRNGKSLELETPIDNFYFELTGVRRGFNKLLECLDKSVAKTIAGKPSKRNVRRPVSSYGATAPANKPPVLADEKERREEERRQVRAYYELADWYGDWSALYWLFEDALNLSASLDAESVSLLNGEVTEDYAISRIEDVRFRMISRMNQARQALPNLARPSFSSSKERQAATRLADFLEKFAVTTEESVAHSQEIADRVLDGQIEIAIDLLQETESSYLTTLERGNFLLAEQVKFIDESTPKFHLFNSMLQVNLAMTALVNGSTAAYEDDFQLLDKDIKETRRVLDMMEDHLSFGRGRVDVMVRQAVQMAIKPEARTKLVEALQTYYESFEVEEAIAKVLTETADEFNRGNYNLDTLVLVDELIVRRNTLIALRGRRIDEYMSYFK